MTTNKTTKSKPLTKIQQLERQISNLEEAIYMAYNDTDELFGPLYLIVQELEKPEPNRYMVKKSIQFWGSGDYFVEEQQNNPHEAGLLKLEINRALTELSWKPIFTAEMAVQRTIDWYKNYYAGANAASLLEADIEYYLSLK
jgi:nucleoside-diphosphate-sugar epimerase